MTCTINENASVVYRPVEKHEQKQALDLWYSVFGADNPGCFERDFTIEGSPKYQEGDTIGAWFDGQLVSALHIRRITLVSGDDDNEYLCGGISNVATLPKYRNQGFSRYLLRLAIERMKQNSEFDISMLATGRYKHYSVLGWEQIRVPNTTIIQWKNFDPVIRNVEWRSASELLSLDRELILTLHKTNPREYQFDRSPSTLFEHWIGWNWQLHKAIMYVHSEKDSTGYIVISKPDNVNEIYVSEWRASNIDVEKTLLKLAADEIRRRHGQQTNITRFHGLPQYMSTDELEQWAGKIIIDPNEDMMIRNIRLPNEIIDKIKSAYLKGSATFWPGDSF